MSKKHHIVPAFFGALLAVPLLLLFLLQCFQFLLKQTVNVRMKNEVYQTIVLAAENVVWEKKEKEIIIGDRMFDIWQYSISNGVFTATGFFDEKETTIRNILMHAGKRAQTAPIIQLLFFTQCFAFLIHWIFYEIGYHKPGTPPVASKNLYPRPFLGILVPPPRFH